MDISEEHVATMFNVEVNAQGGDRMFFQNIYPLTKLHGAASQKDHLIIPNKIRKHKVRCCGPNETYSG
jgi:hypothetical protein